MTAFGHPMAQGSYRISSGYRTAARPTHRGIDFAAPVGTAMYAAGDGVVVDSRSGVGGFGCWIVLDHTVDGQRIGTVYGHMYPADLLVSKGQRVARGQLISRVGANGQVSGPHLHFEVWQGGRFQGFDIDPGPWISHEGPIPDPDPSTFYAVYGQRGDHVLRLQQFMTRVFGSYNPYTPTGYFGDLTRAGIQEFQRRVGLTADGIVGPETFVALTRYGFKG